MKKSILFLTFAAITSISLISCGEDEITPMVCTNGLAGTLQYTSLEGGCWTLQLNSPIRYPVNPYTSGMATTLAITKFPQGYTGVNNQAVKAEFVITNLPSVCRNGVTAELTCVQNQ